MPDPILPPDLATFPDTIPDHVKGESGDRIKYLVAYDVRDATRLRHTHAHLKDFGQPVQYSVFECLLDRGTLDRMWEGIVECIDTEEDWVVLYRLHRPFDEAVRHIGHYRPDLPDEDDIIFI